MTPPGPAPTSAPEFVGGDDLFNEQRREGRCGQGNWGMKQRGSRGILWAMGHMGHAQQLRCGVSGLGNQILTVSSMP